jgi:membrane protease YdiL (CAAX protease family)
MLFVLLPIIVFAASEDILFVGFIQTRLSGFFKSDKTAIYIGSAMFAIAHLPHRIMAGAIDETTITYMIMWFLMHQVFVSVFRRHNAIYATIVLHSLINWAPQAWVWVVPYDTRVPVGVLPHVVVLVLFILTKVWESRIKKRNAIKRESDKA